MSKLDNVNLDNVMERFDRRFRLKKTINLLISFILVLIGIIPMYLVFAQKAGIYAFRWLTVDGTLFTMTGSFIFIMVNIYEIVTGNEMTRVPVYFIRLSCAVSEAVIMIVVFIGFLLGDPSALDEWDEIVTHAIMPVLMVLSFLTNDSPIGRIRPLMRLHGTWFITVYGLIIIQLFATEVMPMSMIPYPFLNPDMLPMWMIVASVLIIYLIAFGIATALYKLNRRLSWLWFEGITK